MSTRLGTVVAMLALLAAAIYASHVRDGGGICPPDYECRGPIGTNNPHCCP